MEKMKVKDILMNLLNEDIDVISAIKQIAGSEEKVVVANEQQDEELLQKITKLEKELRITDEQKKLVEREFHKIKRELEWNKEELLEKTNELEEKTKALDEKEWQNQVAISEMNAQMELLNEKNREYEKKAAEALKKCFVFEKRYADLNTKYNKYLELGDTVIKKLERILNSSVDASETPEIFMAYGVQESNIIALWETIATNFGFYDSCGKTKDLVEIFEYFLGLYKEITFKNIEVHWPQEGEIYDERIHTRTSTSNAVGRIEKVILPGFKIGKNISKKSLVIVG